MATRPELKTILSRLKDAHETLLDIKSGPNAFAQGSKLFEDWIERLCNELMTRLEDPALNSYEIAKREFEELVKTIGKVSVTRLRFIA